MVGLMDKSYTKIFDKDPDAVLKYTRKWGKYLGSDTIATSAWILDDGITKDAEAKTTTNATITLSGGTAGNSYSVTNRITTTTSGETDDRSWLIRVVER